MKILKITALIAVVALPVVLLVGAGNEEKSNAADRTARGKYLVDAFSCTDCHTPHVMGAHGPEPDMSRFLSGHPEDAKFPPPPKLPPGPWIAVSSGDTAWSGPWGISYSANITPDQDTGIGVWTEDMFVQAMRTGKHMSAGRPILPPMPWQGLSKLSDEDLKAIYAYLRTIPPIKNHVPDAVPPGASASAKFD